MMNKQQIVLSLLCLVSASAYATCPVCPNQTACQEVTTQKDEQPKTVVQTEEEVVVTKSATPEAIAPATTNPEEKVTSADEKHAVDVQKTA